MLVVLLFFCFVIDTSEKKETFRTAEPARDNERDQLWVATNPAIVPLKVTCPPSVYRKKKWTSFYWANKTSVNPPWLLNIWPNASSANTIHFSVSELLSLTDGRAVSFFSRSLQKIRIGSPMLSINKKCSSRSWIPMAKLAIGLALNKALPSSHSSRMINDCHTIWNGLMPYWSPTASPNRIVSKWRWPIWMRSIVTRRVWLFPVMNSWSCYWETNLILNVPGQLIRRWIRSASRMPSVLELFQSRKVNALPRSSAVPFAKPLPPMTTSTFNSSFIELFAKWGKNGNVPLLPMSSMKKHRRMSQMQI